MKSLLNKIVLWTIALLLADSRAQALDSQLALTNAALPSGFSPNRCEHHLRLLRWKAQDQP